MYNWPKLKSLFTKFSKLALSNMGTYYLPPHFSISVICIKCLKLQSMVLGWLNHYKFICQPLDDGPLDTEYAWKVCYAYFIIKIMDLLDTVHAD